MVLYYTIPDLHLWKWDDNSSSQMSKYSARRLANALGCWGTVGKKKARALVSPEPIAVSLVLIDPQEDNFCSG